MSQKRGAVKLRMQLHGATTLNMNSVESCHHAVFVKVNADL